MYLSLFYVKPGVLVFAENCEKGGQTVHSQKCCSLLALEQPYAKLYKIICNYSDRHLLDLFNHITYIDIAQSDHITFAHYFYPPFLASIFFSSVKSRREVQDTGFYIKQAYLLVTCRYLLKCREWPWQEQLIAASCVKQARYNMM